MPKYVNSEVPLSLAVFLATDTYDHNPDPHTISATSLLKPIRQLVLSSRIVPESVPIQLEDMVASRMGTAIHDGIERAWTQNYVQAMTDLCYPKQVIERVRINPKPEELQDGEIPIYMEQRLSRKIGKWTVTGKFDFIGDGRLEDFKTTSAYSWVFHTNDTKYIQQGSIYRWLEPKLITQPQMAIQFIFTDWSKAKAMAEPKYPTRRTMQRLFPLNPVGETEQFIRNKLTQIEQYWDAPQADLPLCSDEDLWRSEPVFKYYKNPAKMTRSTKNFESKQDAYLRMSEDGNVGVVIEQPGQVTACKYCPAFTVCSQKDRLMALGELSI